MKILIVTLIKLYQKFLSPDKSWVNYFTGPACRFSPTCSDYALAAIDKYGVVIGSRMSLSRISRCHPFGGAGYDPVK